MFRRRSRHHDDFSREIDAHLDLETDRLIGEGMAPAAARLAAHRRFGSALAATERFYESTRFLWLDQLAQDVRHGARNLLKYPVSCVVAVISLAAGIGATTATLTIRDVVFHKPPALYRLPGELSTVQVASRDHPIRGAGNGVPAPLAALWQQSDIGGVVTAAAPERVRDVRVDDRTEGVRIRPVASNFFATVGVDPAVGHTFATATAHDAKPAVLSHRVWQFLLKGRADVVGAEIWIGSNPYTVVGVMPERFWFQFMDSPIWTPIGDEDLGADQRLEVVIRRAGGVSPAQLANRLQRGLDAYAGGLPAAERDLQLRVSRLEGTPMGNAVVIALPYVLGLAVLLTLLIACANVAILVIAQWTAREHEIAIRASLGAGRGRIVRALVTESVLMSIAGGTLGICTTFALRGLMIRAAGPALVFLDLSIDPAILIEAATVTLATGLAAGIGPALLETRSLHGNPMRAMTSSDRVRQRWRHALVLVEIAVTVALLVVTGGMLNTYQRNYAIDVGYPTRPLVLLRVDNRNGVQTRRVEDALQHLPGVAAAAASTSVPFIAFGPRQRVSAQPGAVETPAEQASIAPGFFATLDVPMRGGRQFTAQDSPRTHTAIVNETLAARLFHGSAAVGQQLWIGNIAYEIVGLVADYKNTALQSHEWDPKVFLPLDAAAAPTQMTFLIRAASDAAAVERGLRRDVPAAAAGLVVAQSLTLDQIIDVSGQEILVGTAPLVPLISTGMLLTAAGIYGVLAFAIARRSRELAVRIAIGASRQHIVRLVAAHSLRLIVLGTGAGVGVTFALSRVVRAFGVEGSFLDPDWISFAAPLLVIGVIGVVATWVPSRRAMKIDTATLLRTT